MLLLPGLIGCIEKIVSGAGRCSARLPENLGVHELLGDFLLQLLQVFGGKLEPWFDIELIHLDNVVFVFILCLAGWGRPVLAEEGGLICAQDNLIACRDDCRHAFLADDIHLLGVGFGLGIGVGVIEEEGYDLLEDLFTDVNGPVDPIGRF